MRLLVLLFSLMLPGSASAAGAPAGLVTIQDLEAVTGSTGFHEVARNPARGAGGDLNFVNREGKLVLMIQMKAGRRLYEANRGDEGMFSHAVSGLGDEAFVGPASSPQYIIYFRKGEQSVSLATYLDFLKGTTRLTMDQLVALARKAAARL